MQLSCKIWSMQNFIFNSIIIVIPKAWVVVTKRPWERLLVTGDLLEICSNTLYTLLRGFCRTCTDCRWWHTWVNSRYSRLINDGIHTRRRLDSGYGCISMLNFRTSLLNPTLCLPCPFFMFWKIHAMSCTLEEKHYISRVTLAPQITLLG